MDVRHYTTVHGTVLYCIALNIKYVKQNPSFYVKSYPCKTHVVCTTNDDTVPISYSFIHAVTNVRYSVNYTNTTRSATDKYVPYSNTIGQFSNITSIFFNLL